MKTEIKGSMTLEKIDPYFARFKMDKAKGLVSSVVVNLKPNVIPEDFEVHTHNMKASFSITVDVKKKPVKK